MLNFEEEGKGTTLTGLGMPPAAGFVPAAPSAPPAAGTRSAASGSRTRASSIPRPT